MDSITDNTINLGNLGILDGPPPTTTRMSGGVSSTTPTRITGDTIQTSGSNNIGNTNEEDDNCAASLKDYDTVRSEMKGKIDKYYTDILGLYTSTYDSYLENINSTDQDKIDYALTKLKPDVQSYNQQLIKINQAMIDRVNNVSKLIDDQKKSLVGKRNEIDSNYVKIDKLKKRKDTLKVEISGNEDFLSQVGDRHEQDSLYKSIYIGINILLLIIIVSGLVYLLI
jgi:Rad3-related DNA helicase